MHESKGFLLIIVIDSLEDALISNRTYLLLQVQQPSTKRLAQRTLSCLVKQKLALFYKEGSDFTNFFMIVIELLSLKPR